MLLVHKDISHMPITELENDSESIWVKVFANKTSHLVASWYRPLGSTSEEFKLFREQLDYIRTHHKGKIYPQPMSQEISTSKILIGQTDLANQVQRLVSRRDKY